MNWLLERIRNFRLDEVEWNTSTFIKLGIGIVGAVAVIWIVQTIVGFFLGLLPWALLAGGIYLAYRILTSRDEDVLPKTQRKNRNIQQERYDAAIQDTTNIEEQPIVKSEVVEETTTTNDEDELIQPDLSRLEEKEHEEPQITDDVMAQIEARRQRLLGED